MDESDNDQSKMNETVSGGDEETKSEILIDDKVFTKEGLHRFLASCSLSSAIDYVFQSYAVVNSAKKIKSAKDDELTFLFHLITSEMLESDFCFPRCAFIEKVFSDSNQSDYKHILWTFSPSPDIDNKPVQSFDQFITYFAESLHSSYQYSIESLVEIFKARQNESYYLHHGPRSQSPDGFFKILFITPKIIFTFKIPPLLFQDIPEEKLEISNWISSTIPFILSDCCEDQIFHSFFSEMPKKSDLVEMIN